MSVHDDEVEQLRAGVNCAAVLEKLTPTWTLDQKESTKRCLKYRRDGEILIVNHDGRGWWDPLSDAKGDVFDLIQHLDRGLNFGQVRQVLRRFVGIEPSTAPAGGPARNDGHRPPPDERWHARWHLRRGSPTWRYLADTRALPQAVLVAGASADAVREGPYGSAWFAHRDHDGALTGIEMRGPNFRSFSPDGRKTLFRLPGSSGTVTRIAVCEAPIDAMSLAALERMRADTVYVATGGGMGPDTIAALARLMRDLRERAGPLVSVAPDGDAAGDRYAARLHQMAGEAGLPSERLHPPPGHKDWNAYLQARGSVTDAWSGLTSAEHPPAAPGVADASPKNGVSGHRQQPSPSDGALPDPPLSPAASALSDRIALFEQQLADRRRPTNAPVSQTIQPNPSSRCGLDPEELPQPPDVPCRARGPGP